MAAKERSDRRIPARDALVSTHGSVRALSAQQILRDSGKTNMLEGRRIHINVLNKKSR